MAKNTISLSCYGIGFTGLLTILFLVLKLTGVIDWSWFWVLSPIWIPISVVILILIAIGVIAIVLKNK